MKKMLFLKFLLICRIHRVYIGSNSLLKMVIIESEDQKLRIDIHFLFYKNQDFDTNAGFS